MTDELALASNAAIVRSNELLSDSNDRIADLAGYGHRSRMLIRGLVVSFVLNILLTGGLGLAYDQAHGAAESARQAAQAANSLSLTNGQNILTSCRAGNGVRANDILIWTDFLSTAAAVKQHGPPATDPILKLVKTTFAPRVCK